MGSCRTSGRGFPVGCPLPPELRDKVLRQTNRLTKRAGRVCKDLGSETEGYRKNCPWLNGMMAAFEVASQ